MENLEEMKKAMENKVKEEKFDMDKAIASIQSKLEELDKEEKKNKKEEKKKVEIKEDKKALKKEKLNERIKKLNSTKKFNILPDIDLDGEELNILKAIESGIDYVNLCKVLDYKPSRLDKMLKKLEGKKMIGSKLEKIELTELGKSFAEKGKDKKNRDKKFQKFIEILSDEEFEDFVSAIKNLKSSIK